MNRSTAPHGRPLRPSWWYRPVGRRRLSDLLLRTAAVVLVLGVLAGGTALTVAAVVEIALAASLAGALIGSRLSARMARAVRVGTRGSGLPGRGR